LATNGSGKFEFPSGDVFDGEWNDSVFHGRGKLVYADGGSYEGYCSEGKAHGRVAQILAVNGQQIGSQHAGNAGDKYDGEWQDIDICIEARDDTK